MAVATVDSLAQLAINLGKNSASVRAGAAYASKASVRQVLAYMERAYASAKEDMAANSGQRPVMATPPTLSFSTTAPSGTDAAVAYPSSTASVAAFDAYFTRGGGAAIRFSGGSPAIAGVYPVPVTINPASFVAGSRSGLGSTIAKRSFFCCAKIMTVEIVANSMAADTAIRVIVDGKWVSLSKVTPPADFTVNQYLTIDFTSAGGRSTAAREIVIEVSGNAALGRVFMAATDAPRPTPPKPQIIIGGDSWVVGPSSSDAYYASPAPIKADGYAAVMADMLSVDLVNVALGGTGYVQAGSGGRPAIPDHLYDFYGKNPDGSVKETYTPVAVFLSALQNDTNNANALSSIVAGFKATINGIRAFYGPYIPIVVTGGYTPRLVSNSIDPTKFAAIVAAENAIFAEFPTDPLLIRIRTATTTPTLFNGTGNTGSPGAIGNGNLDFYGGTDGNHLSYAGNLFNADVTAAATIAGLRAYALAA